MTTKQITDACKAAKFTARQTQHLLSGSGRRREASGGTIEQAVRAACTLYAGRE